MLAFYAVGAVISWATARWLPGVHGRLAAWDRRQRERALWKNLLYGVAWGAVAVLLEEWLKRLAEESAASTPP